MDPESPFSQAFVQVKQEIESDETDYDSQPPSPLIPVEVEMKSEEDSNEERMISDLEKEPDKTNGDINDDSCYCPNCSMTFLTASAFEKHEITCKTGSPVGKKKRKKYFCDVCGLVLANPSSLKRHKSLIHSNLEPLKLHKCELCEAEYPSRIKLKRHLDYHKRECSFKCEQCPEAFRGRKELQTHRKQHERLTPYQCSECPKAYPHASALKVHQRIHTGERPFRCEYCDAAYSCRSNLRVHRRKHTGERPFACDVCKAAFTSRHTLLIHKTTHSDSRPFTCSVCSAAFKTRTTLNKHRHICTEKKEPYRCDVCDKIFSTKMAIKKHIYEHSDRNICSVCKKVCLTSSGLSSHMRSHKRTERNENIKIDNFEDCDHEENADVKVKLENKNDIDENVLSNEDINCIGEEVQEKIVEN